MRDLVQQITAEVMRRMALETNPGPDSMANPASNSASKSASNSAPYLASNPTPSESGDCDDISGADYRRSIALKNPAHPEAFSFMRGATVARVGSGKSGARLTTKALIALRADHALARDAVLRDVDAVMLQEMGLFTVSSVCKERAEYILRPDLGRKLSPEAVEVIRTRCKHSPTVQIYLADGLSGSAVDANARDILPCLTDALTEANISVGTPFFMRYGRVGAMDEISELLDATVTCVLLGERPGLATAGSMSAYIAYRATVGMPESRRTVVSNIHDGGIPPVEAGAYIAGQIMQILKLKASGVALMSGGNGLEG